MKTIGDALVELMTEMGLIENETLDIKKKISNLDSSSLLQIDSVIKLGKLNGSKPQEGVDKALGKKK